MGLSQCPWQLRCLNLWENRICDRGVALLAAAFQEYRGIEYLGLGRNRITDAGLQGVCEPFQLKLLDEAGAQEAKEKIMALEAAREKEAAAKAKAKSKAKPAADAPPQTP